MSNRLISYKLNALFLILASFVVNAPLAKAEIGDDGLDLYSMTLEELLNIEVISASKKSQKLLDIAAAVFVLTQNDIQRSGATSIAEALRLVPGLHVARIDANKWAITSRGFNSRFANKLLVMIDGRSVYTPLFAGTYWAMQDVPLEDIDKIEIIRGSGGSVWGANAVNGIINIITRSAKDSQGNLVSVGAGDEERGFVSLRHGGESDNGTFYRVYAKYFDRDEGFNDLGAHDAHEQGQVGFRLDWLSGDNNTFTFSGDHFSGDADQLLSTAIDPAPSINTFTDTSELSGSNLLLKWQQTRRNDSELSFQAYYDHVSREGALIFEDRDTIDLEFQHRFPVGSKHDLIWGLGYRYISDNTEGNLSYSLNPNERDFGLFSAFIQDEISLMDGKAALTTGIKFEHNDFTGFEFQPNIRLRWDLTESHTIWGAVSRSVRTPARGEHDINLRIISPDPALPFPVFIKGNSQFGSEELVSYEIGYRIQPSDKLYVDIAAFYSDYDELRSIEFSQFPPPVLALTFDNRLKGDSVGLEISTKALLADDWRLQLIYTYLDVNLDLVEDSMDQQSKSEERSSPSHQFSIWSFTEISDSLSLNTGIRYVGEIESPAPGADSYTSVDIHLDWRVNPNLRLSLVGQNLADNHHQEFQPDFIVIQSTEVEQRFYAKASWRF